VGFAGAGGVTNLFAVFDYCREEDELEVPAVKMLVFNGGFYSMIEF
jgi:hypothetical protein